ncbi:MAG: SDR family oxidoreductase [Solirubrobacterales bacterium]|nr:SDR family oxidoreductase [Solirubrobacterales bacterium]
MSAANAARIAVVTGGTAGVGRATVRTFADRGYDVAILARGEAGLDAAAADVRERGRRGLAIECDVADHDAVESAAERVERELGEVDVWVNVAFVGALAFFWDTTPEEYRRMTDVTYMGQVNGTRAALAHMRARDRGVIVNVGSAMAFRSIPLQSAYCGAKHAVKGFTESVMTELKHEKSSVRICMVQLPGLNTPQFDWNLNKMPEHPMPVAPVFQPELPARAIVFLAEHPRRNMWVGISTAYTIIGERLAPWLADLYLARTGVSGQQIDADLPRYGSNVFEARDGEADRGAHGPFDDKAHGSDPVLWLSMRRRAIASGVAAAGIAAAGLLAGRAR